MVVIFILVILLVLLVYIYTEWNNNYYDKFEDITKDNNMDTKQTDIKTRLYTELPESIYDFVAIKNNMGYYRLSNGLEVFLVHCPDYCNKITVEAVINSGFITDPDGYDELNHLIEHLVFMKTKHFNSTLDIQKLIPLAEYNGETSQLDVGLHWTMTSSTEDKARDLIYLSRMLYVLKEMIYNAEFNHDKFEAEKNIVIREYDIYTSNTDNNHSDKIGREVYNNTDFKKIYGTNPENIAKITPQIAEEYYRKFYRPNNMRVFIYGNLPNWPLEITTDTSSGSDSETTDGATTTTKPTPLPKQEMSARLKSFYGQLLKTYFVDNSDEIIKIDDLYADLVADPFKVPSTTLSANEQLQQLGYEYTFDLTTIQEWLKQSQSRLMEQNPQPRLEFITNGPEVKIIPDNKLTQSKTYAIFRHPKFKNQELANINVEYMITGILYDKLFRILREENGLVYSVDVINDTNFYDYTNEAYVISCISGVADIDKLKSVLLAEIGKMHQGNYITQSEYIKYQSKNEVQTDNKVNCSSVISDLEVGIGIRSDYKINNAKFNNDIYNKVSLDTLNQMVAFIFDPNVCELFIFINPSS